jgi:NADPH-dependent 2,4-dienoyl-CoA reductase/sulfur reductase-like enzyme
MTQADVLIVGAGPAGIAAAVRATECGKQVTVLDDNLSEGGQIWRGAPLHPATAHASKWLRRLKASGATLIPGCRVVDGDPGSRTLQAETDEAALDLKYDQLILATGARELFLPFPSWTLPNITGVGGIQALVKSGLPVRGKRILVAGSGPLLLAVAGFLRKHGAIVPAIVEQTTLQQLMGFGLSLAGSPGKLFQAASLKASLGATPYWTSSWITKAEGTTRIERVQIRRPAGLQTLDCDALAIAFGLTPNTELASLLGCDLDNGSVAVDDHQRTSRSEILCAGESTGIGGVDLSLIEGEIAGCIAAGRDDLAKRLFPARRRARHFADALKQAFAPRPELRQLPDARTLICRCEDVPFERLQTCASWRAAKLHTRCGMGPCQGRVCGPALHFLFAWAPDSVRPPLFPVRIAALLASSRK